MGEYNYSPLFLEAHKDTVRQLVALAKEARAVEVKFETVDETRRYRNLVLNLKRSLAMNHPDMGYVHNSLRTAISRDETGMWVLTIGPEAQLKTHRGSLRGARSPMVDLRATQQVSQVLEVNELATKIDLLPLAAILAGQRPETEVLISILPPPEALVYLRDWRDPNTGKGFRIIETSPKLRLRVTESSAEVALPQASDEASP